MRSCAVTWGILPIRYRNRQLFAMDQFFVLRDGLTVGQKGF